MQAAQASLERERAALDAANRKFEQLKTRLEELESSCRRLQTQANTEVEVLRRVIREYRETRESAALEALPASFSTDLAAIFQEEKQVDDELEKVVLQ
jgi:hypothetical protein